MQSLTSAREPRGEFVWNFADYDTGVQGLMRVDGNKRALFTGTAVPPGMHFLRQRWHDIPTFGFGE